MKLCSTPRCLNKARPGQRYCRSCHAAKAVKYRAKLKRELASLRKHSVEHFTKPVKFK